MREESKIRKGISSLTSNDRWYMSYVKRNGWDQKINKEFHKLLKYRRTVLSFFGIDLIAVIVINLWSRLFDEIISLYSIFKFQYQTDWMIAIIVFIFAILKSFLLVSYSKLEGTTHSKVYSLFLIIFNLLPFLVLEVILCRSLRAGIVAFIIEIIIYLLADWFRKFNLFPHIIADIATFIMLSIVSLYFENLNDTYMTAFSIGIIFIRYLMITIFNREWRRTCINFKDLLYYNGQFHFFSEVFSTSLLSIVITVSSKWQESGVILSLLLGGFIYYLAMPFRLFCYTKYGVKSKEMIHWSVGGLLLFIYIGLVNWIDPDGFLSFFPLVLTLIFNKLPRLAEDKWKNYELRISEEGKKIFTRFELFFAIVIFTNYVLLKKGSNWLSKQGWFRIPEKIMPPPFNQDYSFIPILSIVIGAISIVVLLKLINLFIIQNNYLVDKKLKEGVDPTDKNVNS
ncbi:hypothetical protein [Streptococcus tangpeifui]|uniref:hypothetical protein n=1 Tax=Streptococcus tangpeifui TaxID=2709400 RepID=UPI0013ECD291|nr:hypothetical protein [Streptococcus sp. ZJ373]